MTGGASTHQSQVGTGMAFGGQQNATNTSLWNKPTTGQAPTSFGQLGGPQSTTGSLFGQNTNASSSLFGQKPQGSSMFGGPQTPTQTQAPSLFGNQQAQTSGGSLFGAPTIGNTGSLLGQTGQQQQQPGSLFGAQNNQPGMFGNQNTQQVQGSSLFGGGNQSIQQPQGSSLFGGGNQPAQTGSLFGGSQPAQTQQPSLFGAQTQPLQGNSLFSNQQQQSSLFGGNTNQPATGGSSLFGGNTGGSLFGSNTATQQANQPGLFGTSTQQQSSSLFSNQAQPLQAGNQPQGSLFGSASPGLFSNQAVSSSPYASNLNMLCSFPLQSNILANESILDPNYNRGSNNMLAVVLSSLVAGGAINRNDADKLLQPTPFDELVKKRK